MMIPQTILVLDLGPDVFNLAQSHNQSCVCTKPYICICILFNQIYESNLHMCCFVSLRNCVNMHKPDFCSHTCHIWM